MGLLRSGILALAAGLLVAPTEVGPLQQGDRIVFVGDSITEDGTAETGFQTLLKEWLKVKHSGLAVQVINAGVSGDKVTDVQKRFDRGAPGCDKRVVAMQAWGEKAGVFVPRSYQDQRDWLFKVWEKDQKFPWGGGHPPIAGYVAKAAPQVPWMRLWLHCRDKNLDKDKDKDKDAPLAAAESVGQTAWGWELRRVAPK